MIYILICKKKGNIYIKWNLIFHFTQTFNQKNGRNIFILVLGLCFQNQKAYYVFISDDSCSSHSLMSLVRVVGVFMASSSIFHVFQSDDNGEKEEQF